jgi:integrase
MGVFRKYKDKHNKPTGPWFIQYPDSRDPKTGKVKYKTIKASYEKKKAEKLFRAKLDAFQEAEVSGIQIKADMTFSELMDWGLSQEVMKIKSSASDDLGRAKHLKDYFGQQKARQIKPLDVDNFRIRLKQKKSEITKKPLSGTTVNKVISLARRIYYLAIDAGIVSTNPFARRGVYREEPAGKYIPDDEFWKIYNHVPDYLKSVLCVAYLTGMRRGEILELTWDRIDFKNGCIDLTSADTKTDEPRKIYFDSIPVLKNVFLSARNQSKKIQKLVFTKPDGEPVPKWYIQRLLKKACKAAGVRPYRLHDLRHTFNTNMTKAGVEKVVIMKMTGHKTFAMFARYSHLDREQGEAAMKKLDRFLAGKQSQENSSTPYLLPEAKTG